MNNYILQQQKEAKRLIEAIQNDNFYKYYLNDKKIFVQYEQNQDYTAIELKFIKKQLKKQNEEVIKIKDIIKEKEV